MTDRFTTPFGHDTTAHEVLDNVELTGKKALVTGGASGIGIETVRSLAAAGAEVVIGARSVSAAESIVDDLIAATDKKQISVVPLDLSNRASVRTFVSTWEGPLDILINNAGVMASPLMRTLEGWELQFATNHLGHFALSTGLCPALASAADGARVVSVSSSAHIRWPIVFEDIMFEEREYDPWAAYGQSKTANILFAVHADRLWSGDGIRVNSLMPGSININLQRHITPEERAEKRAQTSNPPQPKTPEQGAATSVLLAASPLTTDIGGKYFEDCNEAVPNEPGQGNGLSAFAIDPDIAERLWEVSLDYINS